MVVPNMQEANDIIFDDIVDDILGCSTPESTPNLEPISLDQPTPNSMPYHHHFHRNRRNGNNSFRSL